MPLAPKGTAAPVQNERGRQRKRAVEITRCLPEIIASSHEPGDDVLASGLDSFSMKEKAVPNGRDTDTGNEMVLPARRVVTFTCSGKLRER